jgi:hypothetical protein
VELGQTLYQLVDALWTLLSALGAAIMHWSLLLAWLAWWLLAVNWSKLWPVLARGAWLPVVLLMTVAALVWSQIAPSDWAGVPNFWWQLGGVGLLGAVTLLCGWLQGVFGWQPAELSLHPPVATVHAHGHDEGTGPEHRAIEEVPHEPGHSHGHAHGHGHH